VCGLSLFVDTFGSVCVCSLFGKGMRSEALLLDLVESQPRVISSLTDIYNKSHCDVDLLEAFYAVAPAR
jgi:hypothetical protein